MAGGDLIIKWQNALLIIVTRQSRATAGILNSILYKI